MLLFVSVYVLLSRLDEFGTIDKFSVFGVFDCTFAFCGTRFSFSPSGGLGEKGGSKKPTTRVSVSSVVVIVYLGSGELLISVLFLGSS